MSILDDVKQTPGGNSFAVTSAELRSFCERIERLVEDRRAVNADIALVKAEANAKGYDRRALAEVLKLRAMDTAERNEREALRDLYGQALGIFD